MIRLDRLAQGMARRIRRLQARVRDPITPKDLADALRAVVPPGCRGLLVHSSLARCGYFIGGRARVVGALLRISENLCMPTHTYCYPPSRTSPAPLFDPTRTLSVVGALTNEFWRMEGVTRSLHPTHSLAARGPQASFLTADHETCPTPCGSGTPYAKMIDAGYSVLMLGASLDAYTLFHTAEHDAGVPYLYEPEPYTLRVRTPRSSELNVVMLRQDMTVRRRFAEMDEELLSAGLLRRVSLGKGNVLCIPDSRGAHEFVVDALRRDSSHLLWRS